MICLNDGRRIIHRFECAPFYVNILVRKCYGIEWSMRTASEWPAETVSINTVNWQRHVGVFPRPKVMFLAQGCYNRGAKFKPGAAKTVESESCQGPCNCLRCNGHERCYRPGSATVPFVLITLDSSRGRPARHPCFAQGEGCCLLQCCIELGSQWDRALLHCASKWSLWRTDVQETAWRCEPWQPWQVARWN